MKCFKCGAENDNDALFCSNCGTKLVTGEEVAKAAEEVVEEVKETVSEAAETVKNVSLELEESIDAHMAKMEAELEEEPDLSAILTQQPGVQTAGNAQAQISITPTVNLDMPENHLNEKPEPKLEMRTSKTEELIALKEKEREERRARVEQYERERAREQAKKAEQKETVRPAQQKAAQPKAEGSNQKLLAIISYITWIGWAVGFFSTSSERSEYMKTALNRALILNLLFLLRHLPIVGGAIYWVTGILWIIAVAFTALDKTDKLPVLDDFKVIP